MDLGLQGRKALVLGASKGLGAGTAAALAAEGCEVWIAARSVEALDAQAERIRAAHSGVVRTHAVDLADPASIEKLIGSVDDAGGVDILVANGGGPPPSGALGVPAEIWPAQFQTMIASLIAVTDALVPGMRARRFGRVIAIASSGVVQPIPTLAVSNTLRSALVAYMKTLAGEVAGDGVTVNVLLPGRIATDRLASLDQARAERLGKPVEEVTRASQASIPVGRYGTVEEFAALAAFLAGAPASYVTGSVVRIDGGLIQSIGS
jgi:3-oxoacyl-[acyl-carrier protein] reductase